MTLLVDIGSLSCSCSDHALEELHKALADPPGADIWTVHHDPFISEHIEDVTARMRQRLELVRLALEDPPRYFSAQPEMLTKSAAWDRVDEATRAAIERDLAELSPGSYSLENWLEMVDLVLSRYLPPDLLSEESDYLAIRGVFAGRIKANMSGLSYTRKAAAIAVGVAPVAISAAMTAKWSDRARAVLDFACARAAELIVALTDKVRGSIKSVILEHQERKAYGERVTTEQLQSKLFNTFTELNRDWRRIAVTEVGRNANEGFIASLQPGARVRRLEQYSTACPFCKRIHGMEFDVVDPAKPDKDGWKEVWIGKTNVGRSASPRRRDGNELIARSSDELWWPAAGVQHPHCRGSWHLITTQKLDADPQFAEWLTERLRTAREDRRKRAGSTYS